MPELRAVAELASDAILVLEPGGRVRWTNPACREWLGIDEVADATAALERSWTEEERARFAALLDRDGEVRAFARDLTDATGRTRRVLESRLPARGRGGPDGWVVILTPDPVAPLTESTEPSERIELPHLDATDARRGCLVIGLQIAEVGGEMRPLRDLQHLVTRLTRPEDIVLAPGGGQLVVLAAVSTIPSLKAIAERVVARGRREIREGFTVGIGLRDGDEPLERLIERVGEEHYLRKPPLRGRVPAARSGRRSG